MAAAILAGVEKGDEEIYPGLMSQGVPDGLLQDAKQVEKQIAAMIPS